jgi:hypothetical protein
MAETEPLPRETEPEAQLRSSLEDLSKRIVALEEKQSDEMVKLTAEMVALNRSSTRYAKYTLCVLVIYTLATFLLWITNNYSLKETEKSNKISVEALEQTRISNKTSEESLKISQESLEESRKSNQITLNDFQLNYRPWIALSWVYHYFDEDQRALTLTLSVKNFGNIPGYLTADSIKVYIDDVEHDVSRKWDYEKDEEAFFPQFEYRYFLYIDDKENMYSSFIKKESKIEILYNLKYKGLDDIIHNSSHIIRYNPHERQEYMFIPFSKHFD